MRCDSCGHLNPDGALVCGRCHTPHGGQDSGDQGWLGPGHVILERYRIEIAIGEGAMGQVFRAEDLQARRVVALKLLHPALLRDAKARARMQREALALERIRHPNVVAIHNVFEFERIVGLELEFVHGGSLADRLDREPLPLDRSLELMAGILRGLGAVHAAAVTHRDLKPANILLTPDGVPKIADFGIARDETMWTLTGTGTQLGTPGYMSPEQITGAKVGPATDIYAAGVLLHVMLTRALPYDGESDFGIFRAQVSRPPNLTRLAEVAPPAVVEIVAQALAADPAQRFRSADELGVALSAAALPSPAVPTPTPFRPPPALEHELERAGTGDAARATRVRPPRPAILLAALVVGLLGLVTVVGVALARVVLRGPGSLVVSVVDDTGAAVPEATVAVDGSVRCPSSPCVVDGLAAAAHVVTAVADGYATLAPRQVAIESGAKLALELRLVANDLAAGDRRERTADGNTGLRVTTQGSGLRLAVDGRDQGELPRTLDALAPGSYELGVADRDGRYARWQRRIRIRAGTVLHVEASPQVVRGLVRLEPSASSPGTAVVLVQGEERRVVAALPAALELVGGRTYEVVATKPGYADLSRPITFADGVAEKTLVIELERKAGGDGGAPGKGNAPEGSGFGWLTASSTPPVNVSIDGRPLGMTPVRVRMPVGTHTVAFAHPELGRKVRAVQVKADGEATAAVTF
jgi:serine/threonine-protein kinase